MLWAIAVSAVLGGQKSPDFAAMFGGAEGCFLTRELRSGREVVFNAERVGRRFPPCSTFKIPHTAIALSSGVVDASTRFAWDGKPQRIKGWERDFTLETALKNSAVWVYESIAERLGRGRSAEYVRQIGYGNNDLTGWPGAYWLMSSLKISAREQVDFLARLVRNKLPLDPSALRTTKKWLLVESGEGYKLYAKTGSGIEGEPKGVYAAIQNLKSKINSAGTSVG